MIYQPTKPTFNCISSKAPHSSSKKFFLPFYLFETPISLYFFCFSAFESQCSCQPWKKNKQFSPFLPSSPLWFLSSFYLFFSSPKKTPPFNPRSGASLKGHGSAGHRPKREENWYRGPLGRGDSLSRDGQLSAGERKLSGLACDTRVGV